MKSEMKRKPSWFKIKAPLGTNYRDIKNLMNSLGLHTVCQEANCPNRAECYGSKTATFLILGDTCTRGCTFCNVKRGRPGDLDCEEPRNVAVAAKKMGLKYIVVTSVTRDDLADGGACVFATTIKLIRELNEDCKVEVLIPDFRGNMDSLHTVLDAVPDVLNHNIETVERLYGDVRKGADYGRSLELFKNARNCRPDIPTKSGIMVGLGETFDEIETTLNDLHNSGCQLLTVGQYLAPSDKHHPVEKYYSPNEFDNIKQISLEIGFKGVASGPLIRSSYQASKMYNETGLKKK